MYRARLLPAAARALQPGRLKRSQKWLTAVRNIYPQHRFRIKTKERQEHCAGDPAAID